MLVAWLFSPLYVALDKSVCWMLHLHLVNLDTLILFAIKWILNFKIWCPGVQPALWAHIPRCTVDRYVACLLREEMYLCAGFAAWVAQTQVLRRGDTIPEFQERCLAQPGPERGEKRPWVCPVTRTKARKQPCNVHMLFECSQNALLHHCWLLSRARQTQGLVQL